MKSLYSLLFLFTLGLTCTAQVPSYVPTDGLVGWWPMNASGIDIGPNNLSSQTNGALGSPDRFGTSDGALFFDGLDDYVEVSSNSALDVQGELSISAWFVMDGGTGPGAPPRLVEIRGAYGGGGNAGYVLRTYGNSQTSRSFEARCYSNSGNSNLGVAQTSEVPALEWHHITFTASQSSGISRFYVDGQLIDETVTSDNFDPFDYNNNNLFIGAEPNLAGKWGGSIDDLGIWNRALSPEEIEALFQSQENPSISGCMDETACNYIPQGLTATQYTDSLGYSIASLISSGFDSTNLIGMEYGGGLIYNIEEQGADLVISIVHPPEYADAPVPNMGLDPGSACGAGGQFGGSFLNAPEQCENLVLAGFDDWVLPTIDQVEQVYETLFYSAEFPVNVCATGASGFFKGIDYLSATETCRCYFGTGGILCDAPATNAYEYFPVRQETMPLLTNQSECEYGCNYCGPGTTWDAEMQICLPEIECDSLYNPDVDFDGFIGLTDLLAILSHYNNEWPQWECGDPLGYQGYDYKTVQIGEQCWFAENLRAENYRNGDAIIQVNEASTWQSLSEGGRRIYGLGDMNCGVGGDTIGLCSQSSAEVLNFGGYLYNWYVVAEGSNVCPNGWHAPDNDAFDELLEYAENLSAGLSGLKSTEGWVEGSEGSNQTGFRAIGSGYGGNLGNFSSDGHFTGFWSANASSGTNAHHLQIDERPNSATTGGVFINGNNKKYALSIRCIKDTEQ